MKKKALSVNDKGFSLTSRWANPESERLNGKGPEGTFGFGKLGFGDVSKWSAGVSRPFGNETRPGHARRPEVGHIERKAQPVHSVEALRKFHARKPLQVNEVFIDTTPPEPARQFTGEEEAGRTAEVGMRFDRFYASMKGRKRAKVIEYA